MEAGGVRGLFVALGTGCLAACSLLTSYDGLVPSDQGPSVDGGGPPLDGSANDVRDAGGPRDGAAPPGDASDGAPSATCEAGEAACGSVCVNLSNNPSNCGACGHGCLGAPCVSGACQPITVATGGAPGPIALAGTTLYWGDAHTVTIQEAPATPVDAGAGSLYHATAAPVLALGVDPAVTTLYWLENNEINACALGATCANISSSNTPSPPANLPILVTDSSGIYWPDQQHEILACPLAGCGPNGANGSFFFTGSAADPVSGVAASGGVVYWGGNKLLESCQGGATCATATALPPALADTPTQLFATATTLYVTIDTGIESCTLPSCASLTTIASNQQQPTYVVADANAAYWITSAGLLGCANGCSSPATLFSGTVGGIALDANAVYWTATALGEVLKVAR